MKFTKMHGLGNDFIVIDNRQGSDIRFPALARVLCKRSFSIGADGILAIENSDKADLRMRVYNPDGSEAEMCGNGIRCFACYAYEKGILSKKAMEIETGAGIIKPLIIQDSKNTGEFLVKVDMGRPQLQRSKIPVAGADSPEVIDESITIGSEEFVFSAVSMGNPHCLIFVDEPTDRLVREIGPKVEVHPFFPAKTNVEFIKINNRSHITVRVWERGAGETLACGTGACASTVAGILKGLIENNVKVTLPGGDLQIEWEENGHVQMTGPAELAFEGETPF